METMMSWLWMGLQWPPRLPYIKPVIEPALPMKLQMGVCCQKLEICTTRRFVEWFWAVHVECVFVKPCVWLRNASHIPVDHPSSQICKVGTWNLWSHVPNICGKNGGQIHVCLSWYSETPAIWHQHQYRWELCKYRTSVGINTSRYHLIWLVWICISVHINEIWWMIDVNGDRLVRGRVMLNGIHHFFLGSVVLFTDCALLLTFPF